jgi:class 3 adenylate cyclase
VKGLAILFTDLRGSTALYQRMGDLRAFEMVRDHFEILRECVAVSVMAAFSEPREAVEAAVQMHRRIGQVNPGDLQLKVGLHEGACIAVQLNDRLDYFGTTVNVAARVQAKAAGGEIVVTESTYLQPDVEKLLHAAKFAATKEQVELRGIDGQTAIVRMKRAVPA